MRESGKAVSPCWLWLMFLFTVETAVRAVNQALETGDAESTLHTLQSEYLDLSEVSPENKDYYQEGLLQRKREKAEVCTDRNCFLCVRERRPRSVWVDII